MMLALRKCMNGELIKIGETEQWLCNHDKLVVQRYEDHIVLSTRGTCAVAIRDNRKMCKMLRGQSSASLFEGFTFITSAKWTKYEVIRIDKKEIKGNEENLNPIVQSNQAPKFSNNLNNLKKFNKNTETTYSKVSRIIESDSDIDSPVEDNGRPIKQIRKTILESDEDSDSMNLQTNPITIELDSSDSETESFEEKLKRLNQQSSQSSPNSDSSMKTNLKSQSNSKEQKHSLMGKWLSSIRHRQLLSDDEVEKSSIKKRAKLSRRKREDSLQLNGKNSKNRKIKTNTVSIESSSEDENTFDIVDESDESNSEKSNDDNENEGFEDDMEKNERKEVDRILRECKLIASKLERNIKSWQSKDHKSNSGKVSHVTSLTQISKEETTKGRIIQDDIKGLSKEVVLKPYQIVGVNWLYLLYQHGVSGVLADDMGLGKTIQTISFLTLLRCRQHENKDSQPCLVIVPASVLNNWKREFDRFSPDLNIALYYGTQKEREELQDELHQTGFDVLLTTYTYFERESCIEDRRFLKKFSFQYMVLDEGHSIKNSSSQRFQRISSIRATQRLVLSGTPIQNNLNELLALLSFLMPNLFHHGSDALGSFFEKCGTSHQHQIEKIRHLLSPFILRRLKVDVLDQLPPKTIINQVLKMDSHQKFIYDKMLNEVRERKRRLEENKEKRKQEKKADRSAFSRQLRLLCGDAYTSTTSKVKESSEIPSAAHVFTQLRKAANHPILIRHHFASEEKMSFLANYLCNQGEFGDKCTVEMVRKEIESYSDFQLHDLCVTYGRNSTLRSYQLSEEQLYSSVKFQHLKVLLKDLYKNKHRVLIFSQWTMILDLLQSYMNHLNYRFLRLDGSTKVNERQELIDNFNEDNEIFVFLLSTRAGGLGINLTAADTVILHDLDFNPTIDAQACDRCHRIGQTKPVKIIKMVTEGTVDEQIMKLSDEKMELNNAVLGKNNKDKKKTELSVVEAILESAILSNNSM